LNYSFTDEKPIAGMINYYRLKQVDFDGKHEYSKAVSVNLSVNVIGDAVVYPNPLVIGESSLSYQLLNPSETVSVSVYDITGQQVYHHTENAAQAGMQQMPMPALSKGIYILKISSGATNQTVRILAQ
jgi:hypothetical protein